MYVLSWKLMKCMCIKVFIIRKKIMFILVVLLIWWDFKRYFWVSVNYKGKYWINSNCSIVFSVVSLNEDLVLYYEVYMLIVFLIYNLIDMKISGNLIEENENFGDIVKYCM